MNNQDPQLPFAVYSKHLDSCHHYIDGKPFTRDAACPTQHEAEQIAKELTLQHPSRLVFAGINVGETYDWPSNWGKEFH